MRRPGRRSKSPLGISLFPFLAVLLCTMGALIVLLICLVRRADLSSKPKQAVAASPVGLSAEEIQALENAADDASFVAEQLKGKREEYSRALVSMRDEMGIAERLLRNQEDETKLLESQLIAIREGGASKDALEAAKEYSEKVRAEIEKLEASLRQKKAELKDKPGKLSIIPYKGKSGTTQRPIYVECMHDRVVIQPEGIVFTVDDFLAAKSAGNPLDASLRAVREHFAKKGTTKDEQTPYPLFIVRPGGDVAFLQARSAIVSWEDEFGYELIDESVELAYPPPDTQLADLLRRAANDARKRQEALAQALPGRFRGAGGGGGGGGGSGGTGTGVDGNPSQTGGAGSSFAGGSKRGGGFSSNKARFAATGGGYGAASKRLDTAGAMKKSADSPQGAPRPESSPEASVGGPDSRYVDGVGNGRPARSKYSATEKQEETAQKDGVKSDQEAPIRHGAKKSGDKDGVVGGTGGGEAGLEIKKRGKNWANKEANTTETSVVRSISVRCSATQIMFLPPKGNTSKPVVINWNGDSIEVVDSIAFHVRTRIQSWGMAIGGGYWHPVLDVEVAPDGEERFELLVEFFDQSGIEVRRKTR